MSLRQTLAVVPRSVRTGAGITIFCVSLIGAVAAVHEGVGGSHAHCVPPVLKNSFIGLSGGLVLGLLIALWLLGLGYVYADAHRRNMPAVPWTLIAMFVPNLLGFLAYFALRQPLAQPCTNCGAPRTVNQRFCSSCGYQGPPADPGGSGLNPAASV